MSRRIKLFRLRYMILRIGPWTGRKSYIDAAILSYNQLKPDDNVNEDVNVILHECRHIYRTIYNR